MPEKSIGFEVRMLSNLIRRDVEKHASLHNAGPDNGVRGWAIDFFYENRNRDIFQKDFEEKFQIRRSTASKILKLMEKNGYITRINVESDARLKKIVLTDKAVQLHNFVIEDIEKREKRMRDGLSEVELETFFRVIEKLRKNLENEE